MSRSEKKALLAKFARFNELRNAKPEPRLSTESKDYSKYDMDKVIEMTKYGYNVLDEDEVIYRQKYTVMTYFDRKERRMLKRLNLIDDEDLNE